MKILVCTEGSERSQNAIESAVQIAEATRSEVTVFGVTESESKEAWLLTDLQQSQHLFLEKGLTVEIGSQCGDLIASILQKTEQTIYDLIVIGGRRQARAASSGLSMRAYRIIEAVKTAILVVPEKREAIGKILVCSGGAHYIDTAVRLTGRLAQALRAKVTLLTVIPVPPAMYIRIASQEIDVEKLLRSKTSLGRNLQRAKQVLESFSVPTKVRLRAGLVIDQIHQEIEDQDYDLVVVGTSHGRDPVTHFFLGNVTREIVNRADRPVLVVRSEELPSNPIRRMMAKVFGFASRFRSANR